MAIDEYGNMMSGLESPARAAQAVTPDDANDLPRRTRSVYVGGAGDLAVHMAGSDTVVVFRNLPAGLLPVRVDRVLATGTTATSILALW